MKESLIRYFGNLGEMRFKILIYRQVSFSGSLETSEQGKWIYKA
jgi:hypothetical protein